MRRCAFCGKEFDSQGKVHRRDTCPNCGGDLHSCLQCEFYSEYAHNKCKEPESEWVSDRVKVNFCDFFRFRGGRETGRERSDEARRKLEELFKGDDE